MLILNGLYKLFETIHQYVMDEMYDIAGIKKKLMELQILLELGEIDEEEYSQREKKLLKQLSDAREYHRQQAEDSDEYEEQDTEEKTKNDISSDEDE